MISQMVDQRTLSGFSVPSIFKGVIELSIKKTESCIVLQDISQFQLHFSQLS